MVRVKNYETIQLVYIIYMSRFVEVTPRILYIDTSPDTVHSEIWVTMGHCVIRGKMKLNNTN